MTILALSLVCAICLCLFKKYKDIRLIKEKIKFEKKRNKKKDSNDKDNKGKQKGCKERGTIHLEVLDNSDIIDEDDNKSNDKKIEE